ncbi:hypothetical protein FFT09_22565 [Saccharomonospora piscinae]|nr:hypothetical protein FFT09_22565 [Saccharomonospora piscinae]
MDDRMSGRCCPAGWANPATLDRDGDGVACE